MESHLSSIEYSVFLIFCGAALFGTLALYAKQVLPVMYIVLGALIGPGGFSLIPQVDLLQDLAYIGIIFLLFLLGIDLYPQKLMKIFQSVLVVTVISSAVFFVIGFAIAALFGFSTIEAVITGIATGFSSTIIGIKLLPTTALHHRHIGELVIGILLLQDLLAIIALIVIEGLGKTSGVGSAIFLPVITLPFFVAAAFFLEIYAVRKLMSKFEQIEEYIFLMTIAWCLSLGFCAEMLGLSQEIGAFVAGVTLAASPIARYIAERLHAIRDFFLVLFFVAIGAQFDFYSSLPVIIPALILGTAVLMLKPITYRVLLGKVKESGKLGWEVGVRLGQLSEFSILIVFLALSSGVMSVLAANFLLIATVVTFIVNSYLTVFRYPTPVAVSERLRRN